MLTLSARISSLSGMSSWFDEVVAVRVLDRLGLRRVHCAVVIRPERIVGIKARRGRPWRHDGRCGQQADETGKRHPPLNAAKDDIQVLAIDSRTGIDTEDAVVGVEPEPNAVVRFEILKSRSSRRFATFPAS